MSDRLVAIKTPTSRATTFRTLLGLFAPNKAVDALARADHERELAQNAELRAASAAAQEAHLVATRHATADRLRRLRRALLGSAASIASAVLVAWFFRATDIAPMLPRSVLGIGSIASFAIGTLARLGWRGQRIDGDTSVEHRRRLILHVLFWIGTCWGALALL